MKITKEKKTEKRKVRRGKVEAESRGSGGLKPVSKKRSLMEVLYADEAEGLFRVVLFSPLFFGAWLVAGPVLEQILPFAAITAACIVAVYTQTVHRQKREIIFSRDFELLLFAAQALLVLAFYSLTASAEAGVAAFFSLLLLNCYLHLEFASIFSVLLGCLAVIFSMSIFGMLGIVSQVKPGEIVLVLEHGVLGLVPGSILAAVVVLRHLKVFESQGWLRSKLVQTKKKGEQLRPLGISRVYSLLLFFGPILPVAVVPLGLLPAPFLACALAFYLVPKRADEFFRVTVEDAVLLVKTANLAAGMSLLTFFAAVLAKWGF